MSDKNDVNDTTNGHDELTLSKLKELTTEIKIGKCHKFDSVPNDCVHWVRWHIGFPINTFLGSEIRHLIKDEWHYDEFFKNELEHFDEVGCKQYNSPREKGLRNVLTPTEYKQLFQPQSIPLSIPQPISNHSRVWFESKVVRFEEAIEFIRDWIGADCWGVYTRKFNEYKPVKVYFDSRREYWSEKYNRLNHSTNQSQQSRNWLLNNLRSEFGKWTATNLECVLVMGLSNFYDVYIRHHQGQYLINTVQYVRKPLVN